MKVVAGIPIRRPVWFFDVDEYGERLADVGTHVVDWSNGTAFPDKALDYRKDVQVLAGKHWPTVISKAQFQRVTGEEDFPQQLAGHVKVWRAGILVQQFRPVHAGRRPRRSVDFVELGSTRRRG